MAARRWTLQGNTSGAPGPMQVETAELIDGPALPYKRQLEVMPVADHEKALQAEVEKREEVEGERDGFEGDATLARDLADILSAQIVEKREAAESKLSSVEDRLNRERRKAEEIPTDFNKAERRRELLELLRDKGTEQGGDGP